MPNNASESETRVTTPIQYRDALNGLFRRNNIINTIGDNMKGKIDVTQLQEGDVLIDHLNGDAFLLETLNGKGNAEFKRKVCKNTQTYYIPLELINAIFSEVTCNVFDYDSSGGDTDGDKVVNKYDTNADYREGYNACVEAHDGTDYDIGYDDGYEKGSKDGYTRGIKTTAQVVEIALEAVKEVDDERQEDPK